MTEGNANDRERGRLRLQPHDTRLSRAPGAPCHATGRSCRGTSFPASLFPGLAGRRTVADRITVLAQQYRLLLGKAEERISIGRGHADGGDQSRRRAGRARDGAGSRGDVLDGRADRLADRVLPFHRSVLPGRYRLTEKHARRRAKR